MTTINTLQQLLRQLWTKSTPAPSISRYRVNNNSNYGQDRERLLKCVRALGGGGGGAGGGWVIWGAAVTRSKKLAAPATNTSTTTKATAPSATKNTDTGGKVKAIATKKCWYDTVHARVHGRLGKKRRNILEWQNTHCRPAESGGINCPPAAFMAAVDPVAVHTHMPDDQTLNHSRAEAPGHRTDEGQELMSFRVHKHADGESNACHESAGVRMSGCLQPFDVKNSSGVTRVGNQGQTRRFQESLG